MTDDQIEAFAIRVALGNNGGTWAEHYTEDQRQHWRLFVHDLIRETLVSERDACAALCSAYADNALYDESVETAEALAAAIRARDWGFA